MIYKYFYDIESILSTLNKHLHPEEIKEYRHKKVSEVDMVTLLSSEFKYNKFKADSFIKTIKELKIYNKKIEYNFEDIYTYDYLPFELDTILTTKVTYIDFKSKYIDSGRKTFLHHMIRTYISLLLEHFNIDKKIEDIKKVELYTFFFKFDDDNNLLSRQDTLLYSFLDNFNYSINNEDLYIDHDKKCMEKIDLSDVYYTIVPYARDIVKILMLLNMFVYLEDKEDNKYFITNLFDDISIQKCITGDNIEDIKNECTYFINDGYSSKFYKDCHLSYSSNYKKYTFYSN